MSKSQPSFDAQSETASHNTSPLASPSSQMLWGISSFVALLLNSAVQALPQGDLADLLLPVAPGLDKPVPLTIPTTHHTEQASTLSRIERTTFAFPQLTTHATQLTTAITGVASHPHLPPTPTPAPTLTVKTPRPPTHTPEGNDTYIGITAISTSQNTNTTTSTPTWYPSPSPVDSGPSQGHAVGWRVIGIAVIAISVVGTIILMVVFFDQWWGFLCDVCGRPRTWRGRGKEELVPDWQRSSWEVRVEDDNWPAYPSFGSPPTLQQTQEGVATHTQSRKVDAGRRPDQNTSPNHLEFPPALVPEDNGQVYGARRMPYGPSRRHQKQFSPSDLVNEATAYNYHSPLSRSNTQRSTTSEDAYDGLAT